MGWGWTALVFACKGLFTVQNTKLPYWHENKAVLWTARFNCWIFGFIQGAVWSSAGLTSYPPGAGTGIQFWCTDPCRSSFPSAWSEGSCNSLLSNSLESIGTIFLSFRLSCWWSFDSGCSCSAEVVGRGTGPIVFWCCGMSSSVTATSAVTWSFSSVLGRTSLLSRVRVLRTVSCTLQLTV